MSVIRLTDSMTPEVILEIIGFGSLWAATLVWNFLSGLAEIYCWVMYTKKRQQFIEVKHQSSESWTYIYAEDLYNKARWFLLGFSFNLLVGIYSLSILIIANYVLLPTAFRSPTPDTSINSAILRVLIVAAVFCFFQAKRKDLEHEGHVQDLLNEEYKQNSGKELRRKT